MFSNYVSTFQVLPFDHMVEIPSFGKGPDAFLIFRPKKKTLPFISAPPPFIHPIFTETEAFDTPWSYRELLYAQSSIKAPSSEG